MKTDIYKDTTIRDYLRVIFKHKAIIITTVVVLILFTYIPLSLHTLRYEATVKMLKEGESQTAAEYYREFVTRGRELSDIEIVKLNPIIERTVAALGLYNLPLDYEKRFATPLKKLLIDYRVKKSMQELEKLPEERKRDLFFSMAVRHLKANIKVSQIKDTNIFTISASDFSPNVAVILANVVSRSYIIHDLERQLAEIRLKYGERHPITRQVKDKIEGLQKLLDGRPIPDIEAIGPASVKIIEQAKEAYPARQYDKRLILTLIFFLGIVLGIMFAFGFESLDQTIKSPRDVEAFLNIPFLGSIPKRRPKDKLLLKNLNTSNIYTQFYQNLSDHLDLLIKDKNLRSILITDVESSYDTPVVIANVGICLARKKADYKTLIIDANLRDPSISKIFNVMSAPGLVDVLEGKILFEDAIKDLGSNLYLLTACKAESNPTTLLGSSKMSDVIKMAKEKYEIVLLAGADLKNFTDSVVLSHITDALIIVVNEGKVRRQVIKYALSPLMERKVNIMGAIINNRNFVIPKVIYDRL